MGLASSLFLFFIEVMRLFHLRYLTRRSCILLACWLGMWVLPCHLGQAWEDTDMVLIQAMAKIDTLLQAKQWDSAIQEAQALLGTGGSSTLAWQVEERIGLAYLGKGDHLAALPHFEKAITMAPQAPSPHLNLAATLMALGKRGRAFAEYQQAVLLDPTSWRARLDYGQALLEFQMREESHTQLQAALAECPDCPAIHRALVRYYLQVEDYASAIPYLERLYQTAPDSILRRNLATSYRNTADLPRMVKLLQPGWPGKLSAGEQEMLLEADRNLGHTARALEAVQSLRDGVSVGETAGFWGIVALICLEADRAEEALVAVDRAILLNPENATHRNNRVVILTKLGRQAEAESEWARVLELAPHLKKNRPESSP
jgi:tetratricopeptide (TPR) repeat protein